MCLNCVKFEFFKFSTDEQGYKEVIADVGKLSAVSIQSKASTFMMRATPSKSY